MKKKHPQPPRRRAPNEPQTPQAEPAAAKAADTEPSPNQKVIYADSLDVPAISMPLTHGDSNGVAFTPEEVASLGFSRDPCIHNLWNPVQMRRLLERHEDIGGDSWHRNEVARHLNRASARGPNRLLAQTAEHALRALRDSNGQFASVLERCEDARSADLTTPLPPLLLVGPPGVGKTHFAQALAACLQANLHLVDAPSLTSNAVLLGTEPVWSAAAPGLVYTALIEGDFANPMFVIDEVDKMSRNPSHDPMQQLHAVLEPSSASCLTDQYTGLQLDASRIRWVLTANSLKSIPHSLLSRMEIHPVKPPGPRELLGITGSIAAAVLSSRAPAGFRPLARKLVVELADLPPRVQKALLTRAVQRAVRAGRDHVVEEDLMAAPATAPVLH